MWKDPIIEEIRKVRDKHAAKFNYDLDAITQDLKRGERKAKRKLVNFKSRKPARR